MRMEKSLGSCTQKNLLIQNPHHNQCRSFQVLFHYPYLPLTLPYFESLYLVRVAQAPALPEDLGTHIRVMLGVLR